MEWIKITPETELPNECEMLMSYEWAGDRYYDIAYTIKGRFEAPTLDKFLDSYTHYAVITEPTT